LIIKVRKPCKLIFTGTSGPTKEGRKTPRAGGGLPPAYIEN